MCKLNIRAVYMTMSYPNKVLFGMGLIVVLSTTTAAINKTSDFIGFPEMEENPSLKNKENRHPVYLPSTCPINELYYPGDQKDDWICDCRPAYIYHPASDACWSAFRRGPCKEGEYLVLPLNSVLPVCEKNPCFVDSYVYWNGKCEKLDTTAPCKHNFPTASVLGVNASTLVVGCVRLNLESRFAINSDVEKNLICAPGCKRRVTGKCKS